MGQIDKLMHFSSWPHRKTWIYFLHKASLNLLCSEKRGVSGFICMELDIPVFRSHSLIILLYSNRLPSQWWLDLEQLPCDRSCLEVGSVSMLFKVLVMCWSQWTILWKYYVKHTSLVIRMVHAADGLFFMCSSMVSASDTGYVGSLKAGLICVIFW